MRIPSQRAVNTAQVILKQLEIKVSDDLNLELIAAHFNTFITYRPLQNQEGHLMRADDLGLIVVNEAARHTHKWRFVIAHELGHYMLHPEHDQFHICTTQNLHGLNPTNKHEAEANDFAAELLMPTPLFEQTRLRMVGEEPTSLHTVSKIARSFRTSLTATALRFLQFATEPCAVVHSNQGRIVWWAHAPGFIPKLKRGARLGKGTYASALFDGDQVPNMPLPNSVHAWSKTFRMQHKTLFEHSIWLKSYKSVLTMLSHEPLQ